MNEMSNEEIEVLNWLLANEMIYRGRTRLPISPVLRGIKQLLEGIDNANPSESLKEIENYIDSTIFAKDLINQKHQLLTNINIVKQSLLKAQERELITRDDLIQIIKDIYGDVDKFLDMIDEDNIPMNFTCIYQDEELYIIDNYANRYIHWYKKTHIGRDLHTDMRTKGEIREFFERLSKGNIETTLIIH